MAKRKKWPEWAFTNPSKSHYVRWTEVGKGRDGSIFVNDEDQTVKALRKGRTVGGLQIWVLTKYGKNGRQLKRKTVHLKNRRELKSVVERM